MSRTAQFSDYARASHVYVTPLPAGSVLRSQRIQVWLKDAVTRVKKRPGFPSLEDSANLLGLEIQVARFP
ncbi:MAG: hypothetical protein H0U23_06345 [Blastocatellia bacterium]|nr:hypothetical protein [Blastocatellia bacterium]